MRAVNQRNYSTVEAAARAQDAGAGRAAGERHTVSHSADAAAVLVQHAQTVEALSTVLDLAYLVDDVSEEEQAARQLVSTILASATRAIKSELSR